MLKASFTKFNQFQEQVAARTQELQSNFQETIMYIKKDLEVPLDSPYILDPSGTKFVLSNKSPTPPNGSTPPGPRLVKRAETPPGQPTDKEAS